MGVCCVLVAAGGVSLTVHVTGALRVFGKPRRPSWCIWVAALEGNSWSAPSHGSRLPPLPTPPAPPSPKTLANSHLSQDRSSHLLPQFPNL